MVGEKIETGVDDLMRLLADGQKHFLDELCKQLKISLDVLQLWVDFLVEEKKIILEYSITKPYIYLNDEHKKNVIKEGDINLSYFKEAFIKAAKEKNIPEDKIDFFWQKKLEQYLESYKEYFFKELQIKNVKNPEKYWNEYKKRFLS